MGTLGWWHNIPLSLVYWFVIIHKDGCRSRFLSWGVIITNTMDSYSFGDPVSVVCKRNSRFIVYKSDKNQVPDIFLSVLNRTLRHQMGRNLPRIWVGNSVGSISTHLVFTRLGWLETGLPFMYLFCLPE